MMKKTDFTIRLINFFLKRSLVKDGLKYLLELDNLLYQLQGTWSIKYGNGIHSKHRHINYHDFFIKNIKLNEKILDIGCGNGLLSYKIVKNIPGVNITGIDINSNNIDFAINNYKSNKLKFIVGDVLKVLPDKNFDVIILSNVLEHFKNRVRFLKKLKKKYNPRCFLIRVPTFDRDWRVPLKKELGIDYRLDPTHFIEYTREDFLKELLEAGLKQKSLDIRWGEIWCEVVYE